MHALRHVRCMRVMTYETRIEMAAAAAEYAASRIRQLLRENETVNAMFAAAPSQDEFLDALVGEPDVCWNRVRAFHMDEYVGLPGCSEQGFAAYLDNRVFSRLPFLETHYILSSMSQDPREACDQFGELLESHPLHIVCMGIGENGHIAFNDPGVADFADPCVVKIVKLDPECRQQQVNDGWFSSLESVPRDAITVTVPTLMSAREIVCVVPGSRKRRAVQRTLEGAMTTRCPASVLRRHRSVALFLDMESASEIMKNGLEVE